MDEAIFLSHLPENIAFHEEFHHLRSRDFPPSFGQVLDLLGRLGLSTQKQRKIVEEALQACEITQELVVAKSISVVSYWSPHYPSKLRWIPNPPWNLFFYGQLPTESTPQLAVVGTRKPDEYGNDVVAYILTRLRTRPLELISGLALGIDAIAHLMACEAEIPNFAILGCGVDQIYPKSHEHLAEQILEAGGGILSEFVPETRPHPHHFPRRNRIISGLSDVLWIIQGHAKSGTLHTAHHALEQSKTVAVTPGSIFNDLSAVPHRLLRDGGEPITSPEDLDLLLSSRKIILPGKRGPLH